MRKQTVSQHGPAMGRATASVAGFVLLLCAGAFAQTPAAAPPAPAAPPKKPAQPRTVIVIDAAHGGPETGAKINDHLFEKDVTLAISNRLKGLLQAKGFTVVTTRDADPANTIPTDQRAETANRTHAIACILLHATMSGSGVHLFTTTLQQSGSRNGLIPWQTAQSLYADQSNRLAHEVGISLAHAQFPLVAGQAAIAPLDNFACPAIAIEIAPFVSESSGDPLAVSDTTYQQGIADALTTALVFWRGHSDASTLSSPAEKKQP